MHRRSFVLLSAAGLGSMLTGCGDDDEGFDIKNAPTGPIVLGFSQVGSESGWRLANTKSIQKAAEYRDIQLRFDNAEGDQERQIAALQSYIDARVSVIAFSPVVESGWDGVLGRARDAGIPVVLTDRLIDSKDESLYVCSIGAEFVSEGNLAALYLGHDYVAAKRPIKVVEILGTPDSTPTKQRSEGFAATAAKEKKLQVVDQETGNWSKAGGAAAMRKLLRRNPDLDAVFAQNDEMGLGAVPVLEEAGREPGNKTRIVTVDATKAGLQGLVDGKLNYVVECSPVIGNLLMDVVVDLFHGGSVNKRIASEKAVFNKQSAADALPDRPY
ncbi:ABC transporter substrate-binding protein [Actinoplanes aureus]|jgi:simple sugar transport system substrate-binding protein|uniref:ABC transporter substrate-binding protein n=1 Tax=Actinoplanes aureus TaxID=2792083 RepID=A0A931CCK9_9ACTN|nr:ABC transporter substrate-binding protein [Actinoplanes aureus]MBG0567594.1 ABC transporter substrate-binding protein [Actinoplanes aureus]